MAPGFLTFVVSLAIVFFAAGGFLVAQTSSTSQAAALDVEESPRVAANETTRFEAVSVVLDSGNDALAAFQIEVAAERGRIRIVGVEDGDVPAFAGDRLHFDRDVIDAGNSERIILAAFSTADAASLPTGRRRIATLHIQVVGEGPAEYVSKLMTAADADGERIRPSISIEKGSD